MGIFITKLMVCFSHSLAIVPLVDQRPVVRRAQSLPASGS